MLELSLTKYHKLSGRNVALILLEVASQDEGVARISAF